MCKITKKINKNQKVKVKSMRLLALMKYPTTLLSLSFALLLLVLLQTISHLSRVNISAQMLKIHRTQHLTPLISQ